MGRMPRIQIENAVYYIISAGDHDENLFRENNDYQMYVDLLKKHKDQLKFKLYSFCILPSAINLLIEPSSEGAIPQIMHGLNSTYTKYFNAKYSRKGHLFQERYKMVLIEKEPNLSRMIAYLAARQGKLGGVGGYEGSTPAAIKDDEFTVLDNELNKKSIIGSDEFMDKVKSKLEKERQRAEESGSSGTKYSLSTQRIIKYGSIIAVILFVAAIFMFSKMLKAREDFKKEIAKKDIEMTNKLVTAKEAIYEDLDEKYKADAVSYQAMAKRLEIEKQKSAQLESKLNK